MTQAIHQNWCPDPSLIEQIILNNIPRKFILECVSDFNEAREERNNSTLSLRPSFIKFVTRKWRSYSVETLSPTDAPEIRCLLPEAISMTMAWRPSNDALEILVKTAKVGRAFAEDAIPEFCIYWYERGDTASTWNSKFIQHVKYQWLHYQATIERDATPKTLPPNWQPNDQVLEVFRAANIDTDFAFKKLSEFIIYWTDSGQAYTSWNTKFLQHVKFHWSKQARLSRSQKSSEKRASKIFSDGVQRPIRSTRDISLYEQLTDRSWADDLLVK